MSDQDVRWQQRFSNFKRAIRQLEAAVALSQDRELSSLEQQGLIKTFEFTHELAWNVLKDYLQDQGYQDIKGSRDATRAAFKVELIADGEEWMAMIQSRNTSSHTYNQDTADELADAIVHVYYPLLVSLEATIEKLLP